jgi:hypothetical protein
MSKRIFIAIGVSVLVAVASLHAATQSRQAADALSKKISAITQRAASPRARQPVSVTLTEDELNSWFVYRSARYLPAGVSKPSVTLLGAGAMKGVATLDLEAVAKRRSSGGALAPLSYLGGKVPVTVTGTLHTQAGTGRFDVQSTEIAGIPVPRFLLQELLSIYGASPEQPEGVRMDESFALPANIQRIDVGLGQMVVVQ